jgi:hypothetical protein
MALSGCDGNGGGTSVPFSAMTSPDGTGSVARFKSPANITIAGNNLYVADFDNHSIRKVEIASGEVTTLAGSNGKNGSTDGSGSAALFNRPFGITTDGTNLYVADTGNSTIRKVVIATGAVTTLAGTPGAKGAVDKTGAAARFNAPAGITTDNGTNLYIADSGNNAIRKLVIASKAVTTLSVNNSNSGGNFLFSAMTSASGSGSTAKFKAPYGITTDGANLYVANTGNSAIIKVVLASGVITPLAVSNSSNNSNSFIYSAMTSAKWTGSAAKFKRPFGITTDGTNLYLADSDNNTVRKLDLATDTVTTLAGSGENPGGSADGAGTAARFNFPLGITSENRTNLYVTDNRNNTIRKVVISSGAVTTLSGTPP